MKAAALSALLIFTPASLLGWGNYPTIRWVISGDTQSYAQHSGAGALVNGQWSLYRPHPNKWDNTHSWLCRNASAKNLQGIVGTGDIIYTYGAFGADLAVGLRQQELAADHAYDISDACGLSSILPAGNHDFYGSAPGIAGLNSDRYLGFMATRPRHNPVAASRSPSGLSWIQGLAANYQILVLPFGASAAEESWASTRIASSPAHRRFFVFQHEAINPAQFPNIPTTTAAGRLAAAHGVSKVPMVIGGHYFPADRVQHGVNAIGQHALLVNFQEKDPLTSEPFYGWLVWLEYFTASGQWCLFDENVLTGQRNRFEATTCFLP